MGHPATQPLLYRMNYDSSLPKSVEREPTLQFSLRSLLIAMTAICVMLSLRPYVTVPLAVWEVLGVVAWAALIALQGFLLLRASERYRMPNGNDSKWLAVRRQNALVLTAASVVAPTITFVVFAVLFHTGTDILAVPNSFFTLEGIWFYVWAFFALANSISLLLVLASYALYFHLRRDLPFFAARLIGILNGLAAIGVTVGFYFDV